MSAGIGHDSSGGGVYKRTIISIRVCMCVRAYVCMRVRDVCIRVCAYVCVYMHVRVCARSGIRSMSDNQGGVGVGAGMSE